MQEHSYSFIQVAHVSEIKQGERLLLEIGDLPIMLFNVGNTFYAIGNLCPHDLGELDESELVGYEVICPRHGARFDIRNGKVLRLPATQDIPSYPVKIEQDNILIGIPGN